MAGNVLKWIAERANPAAIAIECDGRQMTYGHLLERSGCIARQLTALCGEMRQGVLRIGVHFPSGMDYVPIALAVLQMGACFVPVPEELSAEEREELIRRTALDALITAKSAEGGTMMETGGQPAFFTSLPCSAEITFSEQAFSALNPAFIRFSSGTTGTAKGVILSHESLRDRIVCANQALHIGPEDRVLWVLPMAHHFAVSIVLYLYYGATTILAEGAGLGSDLLSIGKQSQPTVMYGSPVHYRQLVGACSHASSGWQHLRLAISTAAALDAATASSFLSAFECPLVQAMGIIEAGLPLVNLEAAVECPLAIGKPVPGWDCRVSEPSGELLLRGPGMFDAYLDPWTPKCQVVDAEGWFSTGDVAEVDAAGHVKLIGRLKSLINVGGMKVFAEEIERVLEAHPSVARAMALGRAHSIYGEVPIARLIASGEVKDSREVLRWCRSHLTGWKVPATIEWVEQLPLTASGKLRRVG